MLGQLTQGQTLFLARLKALKKEVAGETWLSRKKDTKDELSKLRDESPFILPGFRGQEVKNMLAITRNKWGEWEEKGYSWSTIERRLLDRLDAVGVLAQATVMEIPIVKQTVITKVVTNEVTRDVVIEKAVIPWKWIIPAGGVLVIGGYAISRRS